MRRTNHRNLVNVGILSGRIPLISLVQFIAVAEHLNFRHAAKALGISQSSVSARVKALEDNLGVLLFEGRSANRRRQALHGACHGGCRSTRSRSEDRGVTGTGWQCLATAGISAEGKRTFR